MFIPIKQHKTAFNLKKNKRVTYPLFKLQSVFVYSIKQIIGFSKKSGRGLQGKQTVFSKGKVACYLKPKFHNRILRKDNFHSLFYVVKFLPRSNNLTHSALLKSSLGGYIITVATQYLTLFSFCKVVPQSIFTAKSIWAQKSWWWPLNLLLPHTHISQIPLYNNFYKNNFYSASAGSIAFFIAGGLWGSWAFILLPSGQPKFIPDFFIVSLGCAHPLIKNKKIIILAGDNIRKGKKAQVRGTVKNANDHPNGGRTRALRCFLTPWAKPAKKSRKPKLITKFKSLSKKNKKQTRILGSDF